MKQEERIHAYLDGELSPEEQRAFEAELAGDAGLRAELDRMRTLFNELNALDDAAVQTDLRAGVLQAITKQPVTSSQPAWLLAAQALGSLAIFALSWMLFGSRLPSLPDFAPSAQLALARLELISSQLQALLSGLQYPQLPVFSLPSLDLSTNNLLLISSSVLLLWLAGNGLLLRDRSTPRQQT